MMKIKKLLSPTLALSLVLSLTACSSSETQSETDEPVLVEDNVYVAIDTGELDLDTLVLPLDDLTYVSIEIDEERSDYDLNVAGEYTLVVILTDTDGKTTEIALTLVVSEQEAQEEVVLEATTKLTNKDSTLDAISSLTEETTLNLVVDNSNPVATKLTSKTTTITAAKYQVFSNLQLISKLTNKNSTLNVVLSMVEDEDTETTSGSYSYSSSYSSSSSWNGGLNTDPTVYGLDPDNPFVQVAMTLLGQGGKCLAVAFTFYNILYETLYYQGYEYYYVGRAASSDWETVESQLEIGSMIWYYNLVSGSTTVDHVAVYLGNGLALHGNWTGGVARIANAYQVAESYSIQIYRLRSLSSSDTSSYTSDMCEVSLDELMANDSLYSWCEENGLLSD